MRWVIAEFTGGLGGYIALQMAVPGIAYREPVSAIAGSVLLLVTGAAVFRILRAGIGVTEEHVLVRTIRRTTAIPWAKVARFSADPTGFRDDVALFVHATDGRRWRTVGCSPTGWSQWTTAIGAYRLLRALEGERQTRAPDRARPFPLRPPEPEDSPLRRWGMPVFMGLGLSVFVSVGAAGLSAGIAELGPALQAAHGGGTDGYYIPQSESCDKGQCTWSGEFRLPDGTITRRNVNLRDAASTMPAGTPVAALDTGANGTVFLRDDPGAWNRAVIDIALGLGLLFLFLAPVISVLLRRLRRP
ncbi:MAG: hypothetical protein FWE35_08000 [Streptosporangiales bacterium]|jgi:hypothetical protein|nr:hypothetical protein [Streptosporangiales bacterium]